MEVTVRVWGCRNLISLVPDMGAHRPFQHPGSGGRRMRGLVPSSATLQFQGKPGLQKILSQKKSFQTKPKPSENSTVSVCSGFISVGWEVAYPQGFGERQPLLTLIYIEKLRGREGNCFVQAIQDWNGNRKLKCHFLIPFSFC